MEIIKEKKNKSRVAIRQAAKKLFWKYGISKTTVEEICHEAAVSKMTFYRNFENKDHLAEITLLNYLEESHRDSRAIMEQSIPFNEKIKEVVLFKHQASNNISEEFLKDVYLTNKPRLQELFEKYRKMVTDATMEDFKNAQKKGEIRKDINLDFMLYMINDMHKKMLDDTLRNLYANPHDLIMELTRFFFYGIVAREE